MRQDYPLHYLKPDLAFTPQEIKPDFVEQRMNSLLWQLAV